MRLKLPTNFNFSIASWRKTRFVQWFKKVTSSNLFFNFVAKGIFTIIILAFTFIPIWIYLGARWLIGPADFWQEFAVFAVSTVVLGGPQFFMCFGGGFLIIALIMEDLN